MKLLLDECLPRKMKFLFSGSGHQCETAREAGFGGKENGELLSLAEGKFGVLITVDKNLKYQQNLTNRKIAILVLRAASNDIDDIRPHLPEILVGLQWIKPGQVVEVGLALNGQNKKLHATGKNEWPRQSAPQSPRSPRQTRHTGISTGLIRISSVGMGSPSSTRLSR